MELEYIEIKLSGYIVLMKNVISKIQSSMVSLKKREVQKSDKFISTKKQPTYS